LQLERSHQQLKIAILFNEESTTSEKQIAIMGPQYSQNILIAVSEYFNYW